MLHLLWNGDKVEDRELALDLFIPRKDSTNQQCTLFIEQPKPYDWEEQLDGWARLATA